MATPLVSPSSLAPRSGGVLPTAGTAAHPLAAEPLARLADAPPAAAAPRRTAEPAGTGTQAPPQALSDDTVVLLLADVAPRWRWWGWWRIARGAQGLRRVAGLRFAKVMGSGFEGGFGLRPSASRTAVFAAFDSEAAADAYIASSRLLQHYRARSVETCLLKLRPWSVRGQWGGQGLSASAPAPEAHASSSAGSATPAASLPRQLPVLALTRASIHWQRAKAFWAKAPPAQADLANAPGCLLAVGLGEAPLLRQCTVSLWENVAAMDAYARSGAHLAAIRASAREGYFSESMFVRFVPVAVQGCWKGAVYG